MDLSERMLKKMNIKNMSGMDKYLEQLFKNATLQDLKRIHQHLEMEFKRNNKEATKYVCDKIKELIDKKELEHEDNTK